jgi:SAM-dependent methyltransferase
VPEPPSAYDELGSAYDAWCRSVTEDIDFYVDLALRSGGPVLEIGVGSGRVAIPTRLAGVEVVGIDASPVMLDLARAKAAGHAVELDLHQGDMRSLPDLGSFPLITAPFRAFLHLRDDRERLTVLRDLRTRLQPGGVLAFDVFHPDTPDIEETHDRWIERERGIFEHATWRPDDRSLTLTVRTATAEATMELWWAEPAGWRRLLEAAGYGEIESYGWFDRSPLLAGSTDSVWVSAGRAPAAADAP